MFIPLWLLALAVVGTVLLFVERETLKVWGLLSLYVSLPFALYVLYQSDTGRMVLGAGLLVGFMVPIVREFTGRNPADAPAAPPARVPH